MTGRSSRWKDDSSEEYHYRLTEDRLVGRTIFGAWVRGFLSGGGEVVDWTGVEKPLHAGSTE